MTFFLLCYVHINHLITYLQHKMFAFLFLPIFSSAVLTSFEYIYRSLSLTHFFFLLMLICFLYDWYFFLITDLFSSIKSRNYLSSSLLKSSLSFLTTLSASTRSNSTRFLSALSCIVPHFFGIRQLQVKMLDISLLSIQLV